MKRSELPSVRATAITKYCV